ncbi:superoxide dismutase [bacterium]|nr:MAG: superoxide dismutase [bacterium]
MALLTADNSIRVRTEIRDLDAPWVSPGEVALTSDSPSNFSAFEPEWELKMLYGGGGMNITPESPEIECQVEGRDGEKRFSRRTLLQWAVAAPAAIALSRVVGDMPAAFAAPKGPFTLPPLPYAYGSLAPTISEMTMRVHHDKHHQAYVDKLNAAVASTPSLAGKTPQALIQNLAAVPESVRTAVRNNGGGHVNHTMFWEIMSPKGGGAFVLVRQIIGVLPDIVAHDGVHAHHQGVVLVGGANDF